MTPWFMLTCHHYSFTPAVFNQILCIAAIYHLGFGVITSDSLEEGFRCVDRKFFVPQGNEALAHSDQPLKEGNVHISAPHIYGSALQELDLIPNSSISFLNIGSGTGYVSSIAAQILGPNALNYGVELHDDVIDHCKAALGKWKSSSIEEAKDDVSIVHFMDDTIADIQSKLFEYMSVHVVFILFAKIYCLCIFFNISHYSH